MDRQAVSRRRKPPKIAAPPLHDIRLVAIDLDGTLLTDCKRISRKAVSALSKLSQRGIQVVIASARPPRSVRHLYQQLQLQTWQINYNGALIWDEPQQKVIFHQPMEPGLVRKMIDRARQRFPQSLVSCEILDRWYTDRHDPNYTTETGRLFKPDVIAPLDQFCSQPITKLLFLGDAVTMGSIESMLAEDFDKQAAMVRTEPELIQVMDRRVGKAAALKMVAEHYNVQPAQIMAIGDAPNDYGMLQLAGVAIAMENADPIVKSVADWIAPSNNNDGVLAALKKYGLC
jgi:Cof subfamily protein (haloacid dehalogenase superfamily)